MRACAAIMRKKLITSSSITRSTKPRPIWVNRSRRGRVPLGSKKAGGAWASLVATTAAANSASLSAKWEYSVSLDTPAARASASMLVSL